jgi:UDP-N-acetylmuramyl pentapeptide phosphotransferase/UDP-N-acetylglucosamine-1-phosphate transferase
MPMGPATGLGSGAQAGWSPALILLCVGAVLLSALLVRTMIAVAVLDTPGHRSAHVRPTPKGGGVGVVASVLVGIPAALWLYGGGPVLAATAILGGVALLALISWLDDVRQFPPVVKLAAQTAAACLVLFGTGPPPLLAPTLGPLPGLVLGFVWLLFVTNALNFIDGLNGLAAGSMALAALFIGLTSTTPLQQSAGLMLAAGLIGFLPFNYPRARIFLGDVGSQPAGLLVGALGLLRCADPAGLSIPGAALVMPLLLWGILYDVTFTLARRWRAGERLSEAHRGHLYQVAFRSGVPAPLVALLHWGFVIWGAVLALALANNVCTPPFAIALACLPQLIWTAFVLRRSRRTALGRW